MSMSKTTKQPFDLKNHAWQLTETSPGVVTLKSVDGKFVLKDVPAQLLISARGYSAGSPSMNGRVSEMTANEPSVSERLSMKAKWTIEKYLGD